MYLFKGYWFNGILYFRFVKSKQLIYYLVVIALTACNVQNDDQYKEDIYSDVLNEPILIPKMEDTTLTYIFNNTEVKVDIWYPRTEIVGTILILQGWNFPRTDWCDNTELCTKALDAGYILVCPEMGKSIYSSTTYPETRENWLKYPTRSWLDSVLIPDLQKNRSLFMKESFNMIVGLSTGARGALLLALDNTDVFDAIACLSGDYNMTMFPDDNLYRGYFGEFAEYKKRWEGEENPMSRISDLKSAIYIGHGKEDKIVPVVHSRSLRDTLTALNISNLYAEREGAKHDYQYWNSEVDTILKFFEAIK